MNPKPTITNAAGLWGARLLAFDQLPSTNSWALEHLTDLQHGDIVQARYQSAGRGRFDREWLSPPGTCLTLSVILDSPRPGDPVTVAVTRMAACAIRATLGSFSLPAMLKWPNDVLVNDRKIAGILAERDDTAGKLVLGTGLNVNLSADDLSAVPLLQPATSMAIASGAQADPVLVRRKLLQELEGKLAMTPADLCAEWNAHDALTGREITIRGAESGVTGQYAGLDDAGRLKLRTTGGYVQVFDSGDVSLTPA